MKYVVLYSGGHSSAICTVEAVRKYGKEKLRSVNLMSLRIVKLKNELKQKEEELLEAISKLNDLPYKIEKIKKEIEIELNK